MLILEIAAGIVLGGVALCLLPAALVVLYRILPLLVAAAVAICVVAGIAFAMANLDWRSVIDGAVTLLYFVATVSAFAVGIYVLGRLIGAGPDPSWLRRKR